MLPSNSAIPLCADKNDATWKQRCSPSSTLAKMKAWVGSFRGGMETIGVRVVLCAFVNLVSASTICKHVVEVLVQRACHAPWVSKFSITYRGTLYVRSNRPQAPFWRIPAPWLGDDKDESGDIAQKCTPDAGPLIRVCPSSRRHPGGSGRLPHVPGNR